ncbi:MAG: DNA polymerase I [Clostridia bacterium]|nr:DNA polymerase I [Clostridia bacterium]
MRKKVEKLVVIDGNSIMNRAFYGIMGSKMLTTQDGRYTNAIYGFLAILFKILEDIEPQYIAVAFDLKGPTLRHEMYSEYKANRHGMPEELAQQMPTIKEILKEMNITIIEQQGYEGDDILGTLAKRGEKDGLEVTILSGDRDTFQLASDNIKIRIPRTKGGKTETEDYDRKRIVEEYGLEPEQLIEVKGLQGDTSDNIPGIPGIGPKTAISLIQKYHTIEELYKSIEEGKDDLKGKQKENVINNKEMAELSKKLGAIDTNVPIKSKTEDLKVQEWNKEVVLKIFEELRFNRYIERFELKEGIKPVVPKEETKLEIIETTEIPKLKGKLYYYLELEEDLSPEKIIKKAIKGISIYSENKIYYIAKHERFEQQLKELFEDESIEKYGYDLAEDYILLKQIGITIKNIVYDAKVATYILNPTSKYAIDVIVRDYLEIENSEILQNYGIEEDEKQTSLFDIEKENKEDRSKVTNCLYAQEIYQLVEVTMKKLEEIEAVELFKNIDIPTVEVLAEMQWNGMYIDIEELESYGREIKDRLEILVKDIYELCGEEFNINSPKQLGEILFERLKLPIVKKTKNGYSTDGDVLEKLRNEHPIIEKILEYRQLMKLNSTYVEGMKPYINPKTHRIHSFFHQTITATGRISSTEPNLQNIPTRFELGKRLRKVFKPEEGKVYIDADYSQIELRVLAHISNDKHMVQAFANGEDIHKQAASKVFNVPIEEVTKEQRGNAKAVNFGIVYGISDFGLGEQLHIPRKEAKQYIEQYLDQYSGIKKFMQEIVEQAKENGYVETLFKRRRYIPELKSTNYMVRQFGNRVAMNTPIQGTAADIMKIAMINVLKELKRRNMKSKIVLQVHDEVLLEVSLDEIEEVKEIIKQHMESATQLSVPLISDVSEAANWYDCK